MINGLLIKDKDRNIFILALACSLVLESNSCCKLKPKVEQHTSFWSNLISKKLGYSVHLCDLETELWNNEKWVFQDEKAKQKLSIAGVICYVWDKECYLLFIIHARDWW